MIGELYKKRKITQHDYTYGVKTYGYNKVMLEDNSVIEVEDTKEQKVIIFIINNMNKCVKDADITSQIYELLREFNKPQYFYAPVGSYNMDYDNNSCEEMDYYDAYNDGEIQMSVENICNILNDYEIPYIYGRFWTMQDVEGIYMKFIETELMKMSF